jgi:hypothetical protein
MNALARQSSTRSCCPSRSHGPSPYALEGSARLMPEAAAGRDTISAKSTVGRPRRAARRAPLSRPAQRLFACTKSAQSVRTSVP